ncbi:MAG: hypothetical protein WAX89_05815 [Alphaproteobacteria bacterium]
MDMRIAFGGLIGAMLAYGINATAKWLWVDYTGLIAFIATMVVAVLLILWAALVDDSFDIKLQKMKANLEGRELTVTYPFQLSAAFVIMAGWLVFRLIG